MGERKAVRLLSKDDGGGTEGAWRGESQAGYRIGRAGD